jgi:hypothetical protein
MPLLSQDAALRRRLGVFLSISPISRAPLPPELTSIVLSYCSLSYHAIEPCSPSKGMEREGEEANDPDHASLVASLVVA